MNGSSSPSSVLQNVTDDNLIFLSDPKTSCLDQGPTVRVESSQRLPRSVSSFFKGSMTVSIHNRSAANDNKNNNDDDDDDDGNMRTLRRSQSMSQSMASNALSSSPHRLRRIPSKEKILVRRTQSQTNLAKDSVRDRARSLEDCEEMDEIRRRDMHKSHGRKKSFSNDDIDRQKSGWSSILKSQKQTQIRLLNNEASECFRNCKYGQALTLFTKACDIAKTDCEESVVLNIGKENAIDEKVLKQVVLASTLNSIATLKWRAFSQFQSALHILHESLIIARYYVGLGGVSPDVIQAANICASNILVNFGGVYLLKNEANKAKQCFNEALRVQTSTLGISHPDVAATVGMLANVEYMSGSIDKAIELYNLVLMVQRKSKRLLYSVLQQQLVKKEIIIHRLNFILKLFIIK